MNKKLVLTVYGKDGEVIFSKDPANGNDVISSLTLFDEVGNEICVAVREFQVPDVKSPNC